MKIVVKTLKGTRFEIQVKPEDSVADVKKNIETVLGATAYPAAEQILIHKGKVLRDETTMEANNVSELSCIAVMKRKSASTGTSASRNAQDQAAPPSSTRAVGLPGDFFYLPQGIPNNGSLDFLPYTQQYQMLRPLVQSNPRIIEEILEEIKEQTPPLFKLIEDNKDDFLRLIKVEPLEGGGTSGSEMAQPQELEADTIQWQPSGHVEVVEVVDEVTIITREEDEFIEQMEAMGFDKMDVVQMLFNCNMNLEVTANYLLDHIHEYQQRNH